ncbi:MAG: prepilin-type N-terminal cleavage/methylation domain-containing protein [Deltaproteobacteria bacterium]|nr:prepilin-type N-terminal cleavage/methylation domain-containing protein [Deltaproteobacteria bacterium]
MGKNNYNAITPLLQHCITPFKPTDGFTLVEVLLSAALLGLMVTGIATLYASGLQSLNNQDDRMLLDSALRSRMEVLVGTNFTALSPGSEVVNVNGQNYTINWNVVSIDLDGDSNPEPNAMQVTVSIAELPDRSLTTILVDNEGGVGKIS